MPHRSGGRGTYLLERTFPGVGLVKRASGTKSVRQFNSMNQMLSAFFTHGRLDILKAMRDRRLHPMDAWSKFNVEGFDAFPVGTAYDSLDRLTEWANEFKAGKRHVQNVQSGVRVLLREARPTERLSELPELLRRYRKTTGPAMFRIVKMAVQKFVRDTMGRRDPLYLMIADIDAPYRPPGRKVFTVVYLRDLDLAEPYKSVVWTLCLTGMGQADYWGDWSIKQNAVWIPGAKNRPRVVPKVGTLVAPTVTYKATLKAWNTATKGAHTLYDCRGSYAVWLEEAGIHPSRVPSYMGHRPRSQTERYQLRMVEPYLDGDAKLLSEYIGDAQKGGKTRLQSDLQHDQNTSTISFDFTTS